jgi:hypothetical protein
VAALELREVRASARRRAVLEPAEQSVADASRELGVDVAIHCQGLVELYRADDRVAEQQCADRSPAVGKSGRPRT